MAVRYFTIGHSNRSLAEFAGMLHGAGVQAVADVRSFPHSRSNTAFNIEVLPGLLQEYQIAYRHFPDLGGRRKMQPDVPEALNAFWKNRSFHNYADYTRSETFRDALAALRAFGQARPVAMMCAEAVWWRCHRRIITDYLLLEGRDVVHLMGHGREDKARPTPGAERQKDGTVVYPARDSGAEAETET